MLRTFNVAITTLSFVSSVSHTRIFILNVGTISYPLIPDLAIDFPYHIHHFSSSSVKGVIWILSLSIFYFIVCYCNPPPPQRTGIHVVIQIVLEGYNNLVASNNCYMLRMLVRYLILWFQILPWIFHTTYTIFLLHP